MGGAGGSLGVFGANMNMGALAGMGAMGMNVGAMGVSAGGAAGLGGAAAAGTGANAGGFRYGY